jgi:Ca2+-binding RTX toxin-like protein
VDGGTLQVDGSIDTSSGIIVGNGGTLGGSGNVSVVAVNAGGTFAPGASAGRIDTGAVAFATGATLAIELGGSAVGQFDQLDVTGTVNLNSDSLGGATLSTSLISAFDPSTIAATGFTIIENDGVDAVTGTFAGLAEGAEFVADKRLFTVSYVGGDGNDVELTSGGASIAGSAAADLIDGLYAPLGEHVATELRDVIDGLGGNDQISGLGGNDTLIGGLGKDRMTGGLGADVFDFNLKTESSKGSHRDVIKDFVHLTDHIDLHDIDAKSKTTLVNDDFKFIGTKAFHHKAGELHYFKQNLAGTAHDKTIIEGDTNGDGKADFQIQLTGLHTLAAGDFIL